MNDQPDEAGRVSPGLRKVLNSHGHGFHYAVLRRADQLSAAQRASWVLDAAEFPVVTGGSTTHIDFILRSRSHQTYLVAECKRVDPARARWCFVRAPYTWRNRREGEVIFDQFVYQPPNLLDQQPRIVSMDRGIYHLGFELKTDAPGEGLAQSSQAINQAMSQVLRATSGLINHHFERSRRSFTTKGMVRFIPVVFTTAQVWVTDVDLGSADIATGDLPTEAVRAQATDWIWCNHNRSPLLRADLEWAHLSGELARELRLEFTRTIAIVGPEGIDKFLTTALEAWLD
jgi:hypothetical protein